jgi:nucleoside-diphosphate-sugar epimerase
VIHLANPLPGTAKQQEDETVRPAVEGMETILQAAVDFKVKKVIVTSSMINMMGNVWKRASGDHHYTKSDFAPYESSDPYGKSKLAQE